MHIDNKFPAFCSGNVVSVDQIVLSPSDLGMLRGFTIFDVMVVEHGRAFLWERHYDRLASSAKSIGLAVPLDKVAYGKALAELIEASPTQELVLRTVLSGGPSENGFTPEPGRETFYILTEERHRLSESIYQEGVKLITLPYERYLPQVKFANHTVSIWDLERRKREGAFDTLYISGGVISEASQGNVFLVKDGVLVTPREEVLWGIVQGLVMELAEAAGIPTEWRSVSLAELLVADEVLLTGSSKGIVPVVDIDGQAIGTGRLGTICAELRAAYEQYIDTGKVKS
ncbi:MAG: aminotransferase class IV family protein [Candidatus Moranbacteria bacterium]|nr:aminotransferase class IV family protein [Candidatus Moranbacteria bacterium]